MTPEIWVIVMGLWGGSAQVITTDPPIFTSKWICERYIQKEIDSKIRVSFKVYCENKTPLMCQGKVCS